MPAANKSNNSYRQYLSLLFLYALYVSSNEAETTYEREILSVTGPWEKSGDKNPLR